MEALAYVVHLGATLAMTGVIWLVQVVQYPLFAAVGADAFARYHAGHTRLIALVVMPLMLAELASAVVLVARPFPGVPRLATWGGLGLLLLVWGSTALVQVPQHSFLAQTFDVGTQRALVAGNWVRTLAWTARAVLWLAVTLALLRPPAAPGT